ncbi:MAG: mechanosensitive ion channel [Candidatus Cloacimonetes bacterium]|nr:mechanosensitive ion channel [Candidatus Cloacimonadota bacterium]
MFSNLGQYSPFERSVIIGKRLEELGQQEKLYSDSLNIVERNGGYTLRYMKKPIMVVTEADSLSLQAPVREIAEAYKQALVDEYFPQFEVYNLRHNIWQIIQIMFLVLLVLIVSGFGFRLVNRVMNWLGKLVARLKKANPLGLVIRGIRFLNAEQFDRFFAIVIGIIRFVFYLLMGYFTVYFMLYVIPATRQMALQLQAYIMKPVMDVGRSVFIYLPNFLFILVVVAVSRYLLKFLSYFFGGIKKGNIRFKNFYPEWADSTYQIVKFLIIFFVVVIIFPYLPGSGSPAFQGISIFVGVLVSLGSTSAISNIIAGIILTYMRAFKVGDYVQVGDRQGVLIETSLLTIRIKTVKNEEISIPNAIALGGNIIDYSTYAKEGDLILHTKVAMGYSIPWQRVEKLLIEAALNSEGINTNKQPFVNITKLNDFYVEYELNAYTDGAESQGALYTSLHRSVLDVFHREGIEMVLPAFTAFRDGNASAIPAQMMEAFSKDKEDNKE